MVLKTNPATLAASQDQTSTVRPAFEPMDDDTVMPAAAAAAAAANTPPAVPVEAQPVVRALSVPAANDVAVVATNGGQAFANEVAAMKGATDFAYGNYKVFKGNLGKISCREDKSTMGTWVKGTMLGWDDHTQISPGVDTPKSKDVVAYSKDGKTVDSVIGEAFTDWVGQPVDAYLNFLRKEEGYNLANGKVYIDVAFAVSDNQAGTTDLIGEVVQITLSPSSIPSFRSYQEQLKAKGIAVSRGLPGFVIPADPFSFYFGCEEASKGDRSWVKLKVTTKQPV